jgi:hypothetical protein
MDGELPSRSDCEGITTWVGTSVGRAATTAACPGIRSIIVRITNNAGSIALFDQTLRVTALKWGLRLSRWRYFLGSCSIT